MGAQQRNAAHQRSGGTDVLAEGRLAHAHDIGDRHRHDVHDPAVFVFGDCGLLHTENFTEFCLCHPLRQSCFTDFISYIHYCHHPSYVLIIHPCVFKIKYFCSSFKKTIDTTKRNCYIESVLKRHHKIWKGGVRMNSTMLRSIMVLHGDTNKDLAIHLGITEQSVSAKINEKGTEFKQGEIAKIRDRYNLTADQVEAIFFS